MSDSASSGTGDTRAPEVTGFPDYDGFPSWLTWKAADGCEVTYGDDGCGIITSFSGDKVFTVSAPAPSGARWFVTEDPRGLAAALVAAADHADALAHEGTTDGN